MPNVARGRRGRRTFPEAQCPIRPGDACPLCRPGARRLLVVTTAGRRPGRPAFRR
ncbi:MAG: DUF6767 domain-containing protein [Nocardioidaceae bacterium]